MEQVKMYTSLVEHAVFVKRQIVKNIILMTYIFTSYIEYKWQLTHNLKINLNSSRHKFTTIAN